MKGRLLLACVVVSGCSRLAGLPDVPPSVTPAAAGLDALASMSEAARRLERPLDEAERARFASAAPDDPLDRARLGRDEIGSGRLEQGLATLGAALALAPEDLVLGNAYRMEVYRLQRKVLAEGKARGERMPELPEFLRAEPGSTLERVARERPGRAIRLQQALAHVDRMVLNPALEIKAPASIDAVHVLTSILDEDPHYVPALVGRGLNHLYRPRKLVWPEHPAPPEDAASRDLSLATAVGAKVGGAPDRLKGILLELLGDAYAHEGKPALARSWWALARDASDDAGLREGIEERMRWTDRDAADRLEEHLEERMADQDHPASDLSFLWSDAARGPS